MIFGRKGNKGSGYLGLPYSGSRMQGEGQLSAFNTNFTGRTMSTLGPDGSAGAGRVLASRADYSGVLEARRAAKLSAADPGLSTRGVRPAYGSRRIPIPAKGLETRGVSPAAGSRMANSMNTRTRRPVMAAGRVDARSVAQINKGLSRPAGARIAGGLETRGVTPAPGSRMAAAFNVNTRAGSMATGRKAGGLGQINHNLRNFKYKPPAARTTAAARSVAGDAGKAASNAKNSFLSGLGGKLSGMSRGTKFGIGAGLLLAASVAGRRDSGSSNEDQRSARY